MQVRATKVFARELNKRIKNNYCIESVELVKIPCNQAWSMIGGGYNDRDIDFMDNTVRCLYVTYKPECYAMGRYVTTGDLLKLCDGIGELTIDNYVSSFLDAYQI